MSIKLPLTDNDHCSLKYEAFDCPGTCRNSLSDLTTICLWRPCLSSSDDVTHWTSVKTWKHVLVVDEESRFISTKLLLLLLCPAYPMITSEICPWEPRVYSHSPATTLLCSKQKQICMESAERTTGHKRPRRWNHFSLCVNPHSPQMQSKLNNERGLTSLSETVMDLLFPIVITWTSFKFKYPPIHLHTLWHNPKYMLTGIESVCITEVLYVVIRK